MKKSGAAGSTGPGPHNAGAGATGPGGSLIKDDGREEIIELLQSIEKNVKEINAKLK